MNSSKDRLRGLQKYFKQTLFISMCIFLIATCNDRNADDNAKAAQDAVYEFPLLILKNHIEKLPLGRFIQYAEDAGGTMTLSEVTSDKNAALWKKSDSDAPNFGFTGSTYWMKGEIKNDSSGDMKLLIELAFPLHDELEFYLSTDGSAMKTTTTGNLRPFSERMFDSMNFVFQVDIPRDKKSIFYLKSKSENSMQFPLTAWSPKRFAEEKSREYGYQFFYFGIVSVMILYNLFFSISVRNRGYIYYVLYVGSLALFQFGLTGLSSQYLWHESPWLATKSIPFFIASTALWLCMFSRSFLDTVNVAPRFDAISRAMAAVSLLLMLLS
ncbi:MAG: hypothetical protein HQK54_08145, partial [Oligoflexales bacterium]|nr:hypothetical protein [Oligoflexales bacterium]